MDVNNSSCTSTNLGSLSHKRQRRKKKNDLQHIFKINRFTKQSK